ncbi:type I toxin-antitoxin system Ibs family toxin, partial [Escherichia albertii]|nr:type I toxin-antitoxin system Ibs family toxin [Escherichia albertii]
VIILIVLLLISFHAY